MGTKRWLGLLAAAGLGMAAWRASRPKPVELEGAVAFVTGGSRGLGLLIAEALGREGCRVAICARDPVELAAARERLERQGIEAFAVRCDVSDPLDVEVAYMAIEAALGPVDVLVNNAGVIEVGPISALTLQDFERDMDINFWGGVHCTIAALSGMHARGRGRIAFIDSIGGRVAVPHLLPYSCAKFALRGFAEGLRAELSGTGVAVTTVVPGLMRTGSPANATFVGDAEAEFLWFALADALPLVSVEPREAAWRVARALKRGDAELTLGWQAQALGLLHDLMPGATQAALGLVNRALPRGGPSAPRRGRELEGYRSPVMAGLREQGRRTGQLSSAHWQEV